MKPILILFLFSTISIKTLSQQWGASTFGQFTNEAVDVEINNNQESYTVGYITGETAFNSATIIPNAQGNGDIYIAKYSPTGLLIWQKTFGGGYSDRAVDLAIGADQNIVVTGQFFGTVTFGSFSLTSSGNSKDIFIVKLDPSGNVIWARKEGGSLAENAYGVTVDHNNSVILTGQFQGTALIGNSTFTSELDEQTNLPSYDLFISKYDASGNPLWEKNGFAHYEDRGLAVAVDNQNNIFFTGQFSDTLDFGGNTYNNIGYNVGFLCKLNPSGQIQFFNLLKAGMVVAYDLEVNSDNNVVVVGDFLGNMTYIDAGGLHSIQNPYSKQIFILRTSNNGNYNWNYTLGSDNQLSAKSVSIDLHKDIFVTGSFECGLSQAHDTATAYFSSVGFKDGYLLKVTNSGQLEYLKHFGGKKDDEGLGVAVLQNDSPFICGSFTRDLNFATSTSPPLTANNNYSLHESYYSETPHYYFLGDDTRNSFLTNFVNSSYERLNYFKGITLPNDSLEGEILSWKTPPHFLNDTLHFCTTDSLYYDPMTWQHYGPLYTYQWSNGSTIWKTIFSTTNNYWVEVKRLDECADETDSSYAISEVIPALPLLTDSDGFNTATPGPSYHDMSLCHPDSIQIWYTSVDPNATLTTNLGSTVFNGPGIHTLYQGTHYWVNVENQYCQNSGNFDLYVNYATPPDIIIPSIVMANASPSPDSITICANDHVHFSGIDLMTNPTGIFDQDITNPRTFVKWTINGSQTGNYTETKTHFAPTASGWYSVTLDIVLGYNNLCGIDTTAYSVTKLFYITVNPNPIWSSSISGDNTLCPNGSIFLVTSNPNPNLHWSGPGIIWNNLNDSIELNASGVYHYEGMITDSITGCSGNFDFTHIIQLKAAPSINSNPSDAIICPYDSVLLFLPNIYASYDWIGPTGSGLSTTNQLTADEIGSYYCHIVDNEGCSLTTPPYLVNEYSTPSITIIPDQYLCDGETTELEIAYDGNASFQWVNPISSADHISVNQPGIYVVEITQCGFTITDSVEIYDGTFSVTISTIDSTLCANQNTVITGSQSGMNYEWNNSQITGASYSVSDSGQYYAEVTNDLGCTATTNTIHIEHVAGSSPPEISDITVCPGSNVTLTNTEPFPINWYDTDTNLVANGNTFAIPNVIHDTVFIMAFVPTTCPIAFGSVNIFVYDSISSYEIQGDSVICYYETGIFSVNTTNESVQWFVGSASLGSSNPINIPYSTLSNNSQLTVQLSNQCFSTSISKNYYLPLQTHITLEADSISLCYYDQEIAAVSTTTVDSIVWNSNLGTEQNDLLHLSGSNQYGNITVFGRDEHGCLTDTIPLTVITPQFSTSITTDFSTYCVGDSGSIYVTTNADSILWTTPFGTFSNDTISFTIDTQHVGNYQIEYWDNLGCHYTDTLVIPIHQIPNLDILPDSIFCLNDIYTFYFPNDTNVYEWTSFGSNTNIPILFDQDLILTATTPNGCIAYDTLVVHTVNCDDALPNIITPNGDGINDSFLIDDAYSQLGNKLIISNRWGTRVLEASPYQNDFDGKNIPNGVYFYIYYPNGMKEPDNFKQGFLHVFGK